MIFMCFLFHSNLSIRKWGKSWGRGRPFTTATVDDGRERKEVQYINNGFMFDFITTPSYFLLGSTILSVSCVGSQLIFSPPRKVYPKGHTLHTHKNAHTTIRQFGYLFYHFRLNIWTRQRGPHSQSTAFFVYVWSSTPKSEKKTRWEQFIYSNV